MKLSNAITVATRFTDKEAYRLPLRCIRFSAGELRATNGHVLLHLRVDDLKDIEVPFLLTPKDAQTYAALPLPLREQFVEFQKGPIDGFPNTEKVLADDTKDEPEYSVSLNPVYVALIGEAMKDVGICGAVLEFRGALKPVIARFPNNDVEMTMAVMPMRHAQAKGLHQRTTKEASHV